MISKNYTLLRWCFSLVVLAMGLGTVSAQTTIPGSATNTAGNNLIPSAGTGGCTVAPQTTGGTIFNLTAELRKPVTALGDWGLRGFITLHNVTDAKYIGSAFLNPDPAPGAAPQPPAAFEPGMPRSVIVSFTVGKLRQY